MKSQNCVCVCVKSCLVDSRTFSIVSTMFDVMEGHVIEYMACISLAGIESRMALVVVTSLAVTILTTIISMVMSVMVTVEVIGVLFLGAVIAPKQVWRRSYSCIFVID